jgi:hypothetical protein
VLKRYGRICFAKVLIDIDGRPRAHLLCPGSPLLEATISAVLERWRNILDTGAVLIDDSDPGDIPRMGKICLHWENPGHKSLDGARGAYEKLSHHKIASLRSRVSICFHEEEST